MCVPAKAVSTVAKTALSTGVLGSTGDKMGAAIDLATGNIAPAQPGQKTTPAAVAMQVAGGTVGAQNPYTKNPGYDETKLTPDLTDTAVLASRRAAAEKLTEGQGRKSTFLTGPQGSIDPKLLPKTMLGYGALDPKRLADPAYRAERQALFRANPGAGGMTAIASAPTGTFSAIAPGLEGSSRGTSSGAQTATPASTFLGTQDAASVNRLADSMGRASGVAAILPRRRTLLGGV